MSGRMRERIRRVAKAVGSLWSLLTNLWRAFGGMLLPRTARGFVFVPSAQVASGERNTLALGGGKQPDERPRQGQNLHCFSPRANSKREPPPPAPGKVPAAASGNAVRALGGSTPPSRSARPARCRRCHRRSRRRRL